MLEYFITENSKSQDFLRYVPLDRYKDLLSGKKISAVPIELYIEGDKAVGSKV